MNVRLKVDEIYERAATGRALVVVGNTAGSQPIEGFRAELLCVNSAGEHVWRFTPKQVKALARILRLVANASE